MKILFLHLIDAKSQPRVIKQKFTRIFHSTSTKRIKLPVSRLRSSPFEGEPSPLAWYDQNSQTGGP